MQVGALPILLRNIISLQRAVANRIIVCVDPAARPDLQRELLRTRRLPYCVDWLEARSGTPIAQLLQQIVRASGDDHLMLVAGNSTYYPALFRQAREWAEGSGALALTCKRPADRRLRAFRRHRVRCRGALPSGSLQP